MAGQGAGKAGFAQGPLGLQGITFGKLQGGGGGKRPGCQAAWEPLCHEGRAGGGAVAQGAEGDGVAALQGDGVAGDGGHNLAPTEPALGDVLIGDDKIEQKAGGGGKGGDDPGGKAVGVDGDAQGGGALGRVERVFQQADLIEMGNQAQAGGCGGAGLATDDKKGAGVFFQRLDAVGNGGGGQAKFGGGKIERATAMDGGKGGKVGVVEHGCLAFGACSSLPCGRSSLLGQRRVTVSER